MTGHSSQNHLGGSLPTTVRGRHPLRMILLSGAVAAVAAASTGVAVAASSATASHGRQAGSAETRLISRRTGPGTRWVSRPNAYRPAGTPVSRSMAASTVSVSDRSVSTRSAPAARRSATGSRPVPTAMLRAPPTAAASTSRQESAM
jgi:hypothetical protein